MDITIGRDAATSKLAVAFNGQTLLLGAAGSVPLSVSRQHCQLTIDDDGNMKIKNLKPQNSTYVNGVAVESRHVGAGDSVALGSGRFTLNLAEVVAAVRKTAPPVVDIRPLRRVWDDYEEFMTHHQVASGRFTALASGTAIFTVGSILITHFCGGNAPSWLYLIYIVPLALLIASVVVRWRDSNWPLRKKAKDLEFHSRYVCPNCHHFLQKSYDLLLQDDACPWCRARFRK